MVWQKGDKLQGGKYIIQEVLGQGGFGITYKVGKQFFIVAGTSLLGVFLGWLGYQFFPQLHPDIWL
ncbi:hypothetical protein WJM97_06715 [Okeanomitos corallinicola TIOX110]|uniref:Serine/threonine protein kinase n=1 Tax=Okeanomitos corallinicola TIOX110 TaxID=3133117 RepID=A0ABZ2UYL2_9CYAN